MTRFLIFFAFSIGVAQALATTAPQLVLQADVHEQDLSLNPEAFDLRQSIKLPLPIPNDFPYFAKNGGLFKLPDEYERWNKVRDGWSASGFIILPTFTHG